MTNILYEKQGSYLQGQEDKAFEIAKGMLAENLSVEVIGRVTKLPKAQILKLQARLAKEETVK